MNKLLEFIAEHMSFLFDGGRFRIDEGFGNLGDAMVAVSSAFVRIEIVRDRGQFLITVRPSAVPADGHALQAICHLIRGEQCELLTCLDPIREAEFLERNIDAIEAAFVPQQWSLSRPLLVQFETEQQRQMFGGTRPI